jgi:hypothetical protein
MENKVNKTRKRCANGERMNKKTGLCEKIKPVSDNIEVLTKDLIDTETPISLISVKPENKTRKRCPKGERMNKKTGVCEKIKPVSDNITIPKLNDSSYDNIEVITKDLIDSEKPITPILAKPENKTRKRCPKGERMNKKTGVCEKINIQDIPVEIKDTFYIEEDKNNNIIIVEKKQFTDSEEVENGVLKKTRKRCANGERLNKKTGQCEKLEKKNIEKEPILRPIEYEEQNYVINKNEDEDEVIESNSNLLLKKNEKHNYYETQSNEYDFLYPTLDDNLFNIKIARHKEFFNTKYDGTIHNIEKQSELLCRAEFELTPHQLFVKNFLSSQTPYNSLLLFHSLGSGKTCTSIGIAEEMRSYMKQVGIKQRILVVASPNVQGNFRQQLFDERKLRKINVTGTGGITSNEDTLWNIESCVGNSLLNEINPTNMRGLTKEKIISQINSIINNYYLFIGYGQLMNYITKKVKISEEESGKYSEKEIKEKEINNMKKYFDNRLIIIDEVHNIRITDDNKDKKIGSMLMKIAKYTDNLHFVLLSATPMFNSYKEIIWLTNLMNLNDKRSTITVNEVFNEDGSFCESKQLEDGTITESGDQLLRRKLTGYVSYIRGENPYTFPYRIYPNVFAPEFSLQSISYPTLQMNSKPIQSPLKYINVYINKTGEYQKNGYLTMINNLRKKSMGYYTKEGNYREMPSFENMESFGYSLLSTPLELLNMIYPSDELDELILKKEKNEIEEEEKINEDYRIISGSVGKLGMSKIMKYRTTSNPLPIRDQFEYLPNVLKNYGPIFTQEKIKTYSSKIYNICNTIKKSKGIVLIYSQYIDGGLLPIALALEEMGFGRYCSMEKYNKPLLKDPKADPIDSLTMLTKKELISSGNNKIFKQAKYIIISGDKSFSPNNNKDVKYATNPENSEGELVKVILISKAGSEGLDFKNIRQIHVLEPWYNMNRIEQIIGRGVRNLSHCGLSFKERNVEIYLHSTIMDSNEEAADLYLYRLAELKAIQIGKVTRLLKENAVDCILNIGQTNFTVDKLNSMLENKNIKISLSSGKEIEYKIGDRPFTEICDYMPECEYKCNPSIEVDENNIIEENYNLDYLKVNNAKLVSKIKELFKEKVFYKRDELINSINIVKVYPPEQIFYALTTLINNKNDYLIDKYGRLGNLINKGEYYLFQPIELTDENISIFERTTPIEYKKKDVILEVPSKIIPEEEIKKYKKTKKINEEIREEIMNEENKEDKNFIDILEKMYLNYNTVFGDIAPIIKTGEKNYYKHAYYVIDHLIVNYDIEKELLKKYIIYHSLDMLLLDDKIKLLKFLYADSRPKHDIKYNEIVMIIEKYFAQRLLYEHERTAIILNKENSWKLYVKEVEDNKNAWVEAEPDDYNYFDKQIDKLDIPDNKINQIVGFVNMFKNGEMVFKIKDVTQARNNIGARCGDSTTKGDVIKLLNKLLESNVYTDSTELLHYGLCVVIEMLMRYFTETGLNGKIYYTTPEETAINDIARFSRI